MADCIRKFLIFSLQGSLYALDLAQVAEVSDLPRLWPIPKAPSYYSGALNFHGDIVAVMNLSLFLGIPGFSPPGKLIVLHHEVASLAFLVESVIKIISEAEASFIPATETSYGQAVLNDGIATLLDLEALVLSAGINMQGNHLPNNNLY